MNKLLTEEEMLENFTTRIVCYEYRLLMKYQQDNNVKRMCIPNTLYWFQVLKQYDQSVKATATIAISHSPYTRDGITYDIAIVNHMILTYDDGTVADVSHEVKSLKNREYFDSIKQLTSAYDFKANKQICDSLPTLIKQHIKMVDVADRINRGKFVLPLNSDLKNYYDDLVFYIHSNLTCEDSE